MTWNSDLMADAGTVSSSNRVKYFCPRDLRPEGAAIPDHMDITASEDPGNAVHQRQEKVRRVITSSILHVSLCQPKNVCSLDSHLTETMVETASEKQSSTRPVLAYLNATIQ